MTLPTNDDVSHRELSIEDLEAVAAGSIWSAIRQDFTKAVNWIETHVPHPPTVPKFPFPIEYLR